MGLSMERHYFKTLVYLVWKDLTRHLKMLFMVSVALAFSLLGFFVSSALLAGFKQTLTNSVINSSGHIVVRPPGEERFIKNASSVISKIREIEHVDKLSSHVNAAFQVALGARTFGVQAVGLEEDDERQVSVIPKSIIQGRFFKSGSNHEVVVGKFLADELEGIGDDGQFVEIGKKIKVSTAAGRRREYEIIGITDTKNILTNGFLYLPKREAEDLIFVSDEISEITIRLDSESRISQVKDDIESLGLPIRVFSWDEQALYIQDLIGAFSVVSNLINVISLLAAAMVMFVVISINTDRKRKEIAILRSLGTEANFVILFFVVEGFLYTIFGILAGSPIFYMIHLKFQRNPLELLIGDLYTFVGVKLVILSAFLFFVITLVAGFYPAWRAAKKTSIRLLWKG